MFDTIGSMNERALWQLGDEELLAALVEGETALRRAYGQQLELVGELLTRNLVVVQGYRSPAQLLQDLLRVSRVEAQRRVGQAEAVTAVQTVTGPEMPAPLPVAAQAVAEGAIGAEHLEAIRRTVKDLPPHLTPATQEIVEETLVQAARELDPVAVTQLGRTLLARLDQDGQPPRDDAPPRSGNELRWAAATAAWTSKAASAPKAPRCSPVCSAHWPNPDPPPTASPTHAPNPNAKATPSSRRYASPPPAPTCPPKPGNDPPSSSPRA
jgi:Domain of unknown function (DUF222)